MEKDTPKDTEDYDKICSPIKTYEEVFSIADKPPKWYLETSNIIPRSSRVIPNCQAVSICEKIPIRLERNKTPKTILCHDMKNGYLEDKYTSEACIGNGYIFTEWHNIDMFIYFSHHFITIPPLAWIQCAHQNGVQILGTIITEWKDGIVLCDKFLRDEEEVLKFVQALVDISHACKLDGWLINIENPILSDKMPLLLQFVTELTQKMHDRIENSVVIWYDSVINTGKLEWQNELNDLNRCFFDVCDGIFLNYSWKEENIQTSRINASERNLDVYVGIDVFGRNTPYQAGLDCYKGVQIARKNNLSVAIFAPGWTHECLDRNPEDTFFHRFLQNNAQFWSSLWPYLYTHPVVSLFDSTFYLGATKEMFSLCNQGLQLHNFDGCLESEIIEDCCLLRMKHNTSNSRITYYNLLATDIELQGKYSLIVETRSVSMQECKRVDVILQFWDKRDKLSTIICCPEQDNEFDDDVCVVYPQDQVDLSSTCAPWVYQLVFNEKVKLLHINATKSSNDEIYLKRLGLVENKD